MKGPWILWLIVGSALLFAAYLGLGGRALWRRAEQPVRIIGKVLRFSAVEGASQFELPPAHVVSFDGTHYLVRFITPANIGGESTESALITARHKGYTISSARAYGMLAVCGQTSNGHDFIACVNTG